MPTPFMCHECDKPTMNNTGLCDSCVEPTTADEYNEEYYDYKEKGRNKRRNSVKPKRAYRDARQNNTMAKSFKRKAKLFSNQNRS